MNRLGAAYWSKGELVESKKRHKRSISTADSLGDMSLVMRNIGSLGNLYDAAGYNASCVEYFRQALQYFVEQGNLNRIFVYYNNIGRSYLEANKLDSAKNYLNKANEIYDEEFNIMRPLLLLIWLNCIKLGENELAESFLTESLKLATERGDQHTICRLKRLQAERLLDTNALERALVKALKSEEIAQLTGRYKLIELTSRTLFKAHRSNGNVAETFDVLDQKNEHGELLKDVRVKNQQYSHQCDKIFSARK